MSYYEQLLMADAENKEMILEEFVGQVMEVTPVVKRGEMAQWVIWKITDRERRLFTFFEKERGGKWDFVVSYGGEGKMRCCEMDYGPYYMDCGAKGLRLNLRGFLAHLIAEKGFPEGGGVALTKYVGVDYYLLQWWRPEKQNYLYPVLWNPKKEEYAKRQLEEDREELERDRSLHEKRVMESKFYNQNSAAQVEKRLSERHAAIYERVLGAGSSD